MSCTFEAACLNTDKYKDKLEACKKTNPNNVNVCMGLSNECMSCIQGLAPGEIHSKCCSTDPNEFVESFFKTNMKWLIPVIVIGGLFLLVLIILLVSALFL